MNEAETTLVGNMGGEPELRFTPNGVAVCKFSVAVTPRVRDRESNEWKDGEATWYNCTAWRELGEHVAETLVRGTRVIVKGRLSLRQYEAKDGSKGASLDLEVDAVGPELRYATAKVTKAGKSSNTGASADPGDPWASASKERPAASADTQRTAQAEEAPTPW
jgi:single-strand DNA-binding protein